MSPKEKETDARIRIDIERNTIKRLSLLEELDVLVTKIRRDEELKYKRERKL